MKRPTGAFILALVGGSLSMVGLSYQVLTLYRYLPEPAPASIGLVIVIVSIFLHELPERHVTLGAVIASVSVAQLFSSTIAIIVGGVLMGYYSIILYVPIAGSIISLLGGLAAILWKP